MIVYAIRVKGHLDLDWSAWFNDLRISYEEDGSTLLCGPLADEAALHGVLMKVRDLALPLLAVSRVAAGESKDDGWPAMERAHRGEEHNVRTGSGNGEERRKSS
jgi:hypothetical protein